MITVYSTYVKLINDYKQGLKFTVHFSAACGLKKIIKNNFGSCAMLNPVLHNWNRRALESYFFTVEHFLKILWPSFFQEPNLAPQVGVPKVRC